MRINSFGGFADFAGEYLSAKINILVISIKVEISCKVHLILFAVHGKITF